MFPELTMVFIRRFIEERSCSQLALNDISVYPTEKLSPFIFAGNNAHTSVWLPKTEIGRWVVYISLAITDTGHLRYFPWAKYLKCQVAISLWEVRSCFSPGQNKWPFLSVAIGTEHEHGWYCGLWFCQKKQKKRHSVQPSDEWMKIASKNGIQKKKKGQKANCAGWTGRCSLLVTQ